MHLLIIDVIKYYKEGYSLVEIARQLNILHARLVQLVADNPDDFLRDTTLKPVIYHPIFGRMPQKVPGTYGVPQLLLLSGQCCFPLWGDAEQPNPLSLMCGEPIEHDKRKYCDFHHALAHRAVKPLCFEDL